MAQRFNRSCRYSGCVALTRDRSGYCDKHVAHTGDAERLRNRMRRDNDPIWKLYESTRWRRFSHWLRAQNPICQRLNGGIQCTKPSGLVHHLVSPRMRPELLLDASNCVCLCDSVCHPSSDGTPTWIAGRDYVATEFSLPRLCLHTEEN